MLLPKLSSTMDKNTLALIRCHWTRLVRKYFGVKFMNFVLHPSWNRATYRAHLKSFLTNKLNENIFDPLLYEHPLDIWCMYLLSLPISLSLSLSLYFCTQHSSAAISYSESTQFLGNRPASDPYAEELSLSKYVSSVWDSINKCISQSNRNP